MLGIANFLARNNEIFIISVFGDRDEHNFIKRAVDGRIKIETLALTKKDFLLHGTKKLFERLQLIEPDIVHSHGLQADILTAKLDGKFKKISTIHSNILEDFRYQFGGVVSVLLIKYRLKIMKEFDENVCCSKSVYDVLSKKTIVPMSYIRNGIDVKKYKSDKRIEKEVRKELGVSADSKIYITCAPLIKRKKVFELAQLVYPVLENNEYFVIIGDGPEFVDCEKLKNKNIILLGHKDSPARYYIASDVYLSNSASEGLPISVLEAIASDNLLLLSDISAHRECLEIIPNKYYGELFSKNNFAKGFRKISKQIKNSKREVLDKYNISDERMGSEYVNLYQEVVNG